MAVLSRISSDAAAFQPAVGFIFLAIIFVVIKYLYHTDTPKIKNLPEVPGLPLFGSLLKFGENHALVAQKLAEKYGPVFQVRLGNRRIVFANTFDSVKQLWITNQAALISRPTLHTFHKVVSTSQGFTIGTSPWDESCKQRRKAAATALNRPAVQSYMPIIDLEAVVSIKELLEDSKDGTVDINPIAYFQRFALNTSLTLNYGIRIDGGINDALLKEICDVERAISLFRSTSNNWQDYVPLLRLLPNSNKDAIEYRARRDRYLTFLLNKLKEQIKAGTDKPCITGNILKDPEAKLNEQEIKSICLTMVSAGLDTVPANLIMGLAYLSSDHGQEIQERAYEEIMKVYPDGDAWERCLIEEKVPYVTAIVREVLRFFTVIPICLPRTSVKDIQYKDAIIPAGTTFYMLDLSTDSFASSKNAYAADYDPDHFKDPYTFSVERYLHNPEGAGTPHYAYGAGLRMCAGSHLANRELYTAFIRLITAFHIVPPKDPKDRPVLDGLGYNAIPTALVADAKPFKCGFKPRNKALLEKWLREGEQRTMHLNDTGILSNDW
ncbi:cytochrome P450 phenylacetate 2-hydroxylase-like protein [Xylogone sp. PMI_703]|nr:cytochrome P450 phenylacetate 2-hydroxylase-like protein [Xylogone sp. PMI_703]